MRDNLLTKYDKSCIILCVIGIAPAEPEIYSKERLHETLTVKLH